MFVEHEYADNDYTIEGTLGHARVHTEGQTLRGELFQCRSVYLYSKRYGICGKADLVEERHGVVYPVEYKKGRLGPWTNNALQLCAQALCLEEMLETARGAPVHIPQAYLFYASTGRRKAVPLTDERLKATQKSTTLLDVPLIKVSQVVFGRATVTAATVPALLAPYSCMLLE
jgi:CRISPR-associated exonuclease Cas4